MRFGQLLSEKRRATDLSLEELARSAGLLPAQVAAYESGNELPGFDDCYRLSMAITARGGQRFVMQDLWMALRDDQLHLAVSSRMQRDQGRGKDIQKQPQIK
ncbi:MAG TPA: helix-turn-helix transcriptional regulator [Blastocatellia bacterium]|nr:helix-turn-helix transcriptional regulator [Blastocatellia bacterium]